MYTIMFHNFINIDPGLGVPVVRVAAGYSCSEYSSRRRARFLWSVAQSTPASARERESDGVETWTNSGACGGPAFLVESFLASR